jgi:hypothetical protein
MKSRYRRPSDRRFSIPDRFGYLFRDPQTERSKRQDAMPATTLSLVAGIAL